MRVKLTNVRLSYPHIFEQAVFDGDEVGYEATFILEPTHPDLPTLRETIHKVGVAAWGAEEWKEKAKIFADTSRIPLKSGKKDPGYEGNFYIKGRSANRMPMALDRARRVLTSDTGLFYGGCYVNAALNIWALEKKNPRICSSLEAIQFSHDGEPFGAPRINADEFDDLTQNNKNTGGMGNSATDFYDDIPF